MEYTRSTPPPPPPPASSSTPTSLADFFRPPPRNATPRRLPKSDNSRRIEDFRSAYELYGITPPKIEPGMLYTDLAGKRRRIPSNGRGFDALEKLVARYAEEEHRKLMTTPAGHVALEAPSSASHSHSQSWTFRVPKVDEPWGRSHEALRIATRIHAPEIPLNHGRLYRIEVVSDMSRFGLPNITHTAEIRVNSPKDLNRMMIHNMPQIATPAPAPAPLFAETNEESAALAVAAGAVPGPWAGGGDWSSGGGGDQTDSTDNPMASTDSIVTLTEIYEVGGGYEGDMPSMEDGVVYNCLAREPIFVLQRKLGLVKEKRAALGTGQRGRPAAGSVKEPDTDEVKQARKHAAIESKVLQDRLRETVEWSDFAISKGGVKREDEAMLADLLKACGRRSIRVVMPFCKRFKYLQVDNPNIAKATPSRGCTGRNVPQGPICCVLTSPSHVEPNFTFKEDDEGIEISVDEPTKLSPEEMTEKWDSLVLMGASAWSTGDMKCPTTIHCPGEGSFVVDTPYNRWRDEKLSPMISGHGILLENLPEFAREMIEQCVRLTLRTKFPAYPKLFAELDTMSRARDTDRGIEYSELLRNLPSANKTAWDTRIRQADQSRAYTRALGAHMGSLLLKADHTMGRVAEGFTFSDPTKSPADAAAYTEELDGVLAAAEGLMVVGDVDIRDVCMTPALQAYYQSIGVFETEIKGCKRKWDFTSWNWVLKSTAAAGGTGDAWGVRDAFARICNDNQDPKEPRGGGGDDFVPQACVTFAEARFWRMIGVRFVAKTCLVSYDLCKIEWDESCYESDPRLGVRFYAKAVGIMSKIFKTDTTTMIGDYEKACQWKAIIDRYGDEQEESSVRLVGNRISVVYGKKRTFTNAHIAAYIMACSRIQLVLQTILVPPHRRLETVTDGIYYLQSPGDEDVKLFPFYTVDADTKSQGAIPVVALGPSLSCTAPHNDRLCAVAGSGPEHTKLNYRNPLISGPFNLKPIIITGGAGTGKSTLVAFHSTFIYAVSAAPSHLLRQDHEDKWAQTLCHARALGQGRNMSADGLDLDINPPGCLVVDEATMITEYERVKLTKNAAELSIKIIFIGDFCPVNGVPLQMPPIAGQSMLIGGLHRYHVLKQHRTRDETLVAMQATLREIASGAIGGRCTRPARLLGKGVVEETINIVEGWFMQYNENNIVTPSEVRGLYEHGTSIILAATKVCCHCSQALCETCTCPTATCADDLNCVRGKDPRRVNIARANEYSSVALDWTRAIPPTTSGDVTWRCLNIIRNTDLVNGSTFQANAEDPVYDGISLKDRIGKDITRSTCATYHSFQGLTFEPREDGREKLIIDPRFVWDPTMLIVAISRVRKASSMYWIRQPGGRYMSARARESMMHLQGKFDTAVEAMRLNGTPDSPYPEFTHVVEERPIPGGRYVPDLALINASGEIVHVIEIVATNPPEDEKMACYAAMGIGCTVINVNPHPHPPPDRLE